MGENWSIVLSVLESPDSSLVGLQKRFTASPITIGRAEDNDFIVPDPTVSRSHATLRITSDYSRVFITDSSTHGTTVSGKQVPKGLGSGFTVKNGDNIRIGGTVLRFELNLKQSVQATFIGKVDRSALDTPSDNQTVPVPDYGQSAVSSAASSEPPEPLDYVEVDETRPGTSPLYIGIIVVCLLILVYLMFFQ